MYISHVYYLVFHEEKPVTINIPDPACVDHVDKEFKI